MKLPLHLFFQLLFVLNLSSQEILQGTVFDSETGFPMPYVNVIIENTSIGTITNDDGAFKIIIPEKYNNHNIIISSLGYKPFQKQINLLLKVDNIELSINPQAEELDEVLVQATINKPEGLTIVQKAFENYRINFPSSPYLAKGFVRHTERTKNEYKWLVESAFEMYDIGSPNNIVKINSIESRKSLDNRNLDTIARLRAYLKDHTGYGFKKRDKKARNYKNNYNKEYIVKALAYYDNHFTGGYNKKIGLIEKIINKNKIRNFNNRRKSTFSDENLQKIKFTTDSVYTSGEEKFYKVRFSIPYNNYPQLGLGWFIIRAEDYAIFEYNYSLALGKNHHYRKATGNKVQYNIYVRYREFNDKMYTSYISYKSFKINPSINNYRENGKMFDGTYSHDEILFSEIINVGVENLNTEDWKDNIFSNSVYNKIFWESYNFILESKEEKQLIEDLTKKVKLEKQFSQQ